MTSTPSVTIQLPALSETEAAHLLEALQDLTHIVQVYYGLPHHRAAATDEAGSPPETPTADLFRDELPF